MARVTMGTGKGTLRRTAITLIIAVTMGGCGSDEEADPPREGGTVATAPREEPAGGSEQRANPSPALDQRLIEAAGAGDADAVRSLLDAGARVTARDESGATALVAAAYEGHVDAARELLDAGADVNAKDETEQSAFLLAASEGYPELLELSLENGANVNSKDSFNGTALIRAAERGHVEVVDRLLETEVEVDHVNELGWTALMEAVIRGPGGPEHTEVVRLLVDAGADPNIPDDAGVTPLAHAEQLGYTEIAEILREAGGEV